MLKITNNTSQDIYLNYTSGNLTNISGFTTFPNGNYTVPSGITATGTIATNSPYPSPYPSIPVNNLNVSIPGIQPISSTVINLSGQSNSGFIKDDTYEACFHQCYTNNPPWATTIGLCLALANFGAQVISYDFTSPTVNGTKVYSIEFTDNPNYQMKINPNYCNQMRCPDGQVYQNPSSSSPLGQCINCPTGQTAADLNNCCPIGEYINNGTCEQCSNGFGCGTSCCPSQNCDSTQMPPTCFSRTLSSKDNSTSQSFNLTQTDTGLFNLNVILPFSLETFHNNLSERSFYLICRDINNNGNFQFSTSQWRLNEIDPINLTIFNGVTGTIQIASGPDNTTTVITGTGLISDNQVSTNITTANIYQPDGLTPIGNFLGFYNLTWSTTTSS